MANTSAPSKRLSGWNRLFIVVAIGWALVAPWLLIFQGNEPVERLYRMCAESAYRNYGASDSLIRLDRTKYHAELDKCSSDLQRRYLGIDKLGAALIGIGDSRVSLIVWGFILIPPALVWPSVGPSAGLLCGWRQGSVDGAKAVLNVLMRPPVNEQDGD
jgi:hypothetical protein